MRKVANSLVIAFTFLVSITALAVDGSSGCVPGWYVFKENSLVSSSFRSTTNSFLSPVMTIGMTVGTSNCTKHTLVRTEKESLYYTTHNYFELKSSIAKGHVEYLSALATTIGCPESAQSEFNMLLKSNYKNVVPSEKNDPEKMLFEVYKIIFSSPRLTQQCSLS